MNEQRTIWTGKGARRLLLVLHWADGGVFSLFDETQYRAGCWMLPADCIHVEMPPHAQACMSDPSRLL